jgi:hypothetical protein
MSRENDQIAFLETSAVQAVTWGIRFAGSCRLSSTWSSFAGFPVLSQSILFEALLAAVFISQ